MVRKYSVLIPMIVVFIFAMSACGKKQTADTTAAVEPTPVEEPVEPPTEDFTEAVVTEPEVREAPMPVLADIFFDYDKAGLTTDSKRVLEKNATQLKTATSVNIIIEGHCDERGTNAYNLALGEKRAIAARDFLRSLGVSSNRVKTVSYGEERPFDRGNNERAWEKNRRAHFVISSR